MKKLFLSLLVIFIFTVVSGCYSMAVSAEEYFSIGMAYYDLGKFEEAEKFLNRAKQAKRTMVASTYNLGRIAFEMQRYEEAAKYFESILKRDKENVLALKAAAYSRIRTGEIQKAEKHYSKLLSIVPESADDGYNHALVLFAMGRFSSAEEVMLKYPIALEENKDLMLLFARNQKAQNKIEAVDSFSNWLGTHSDAKVRYEYAQTLEHHELYARSIEEYRKTLTDLAADSNDPKRTDVRFALGRVLLIADSSSNEGIVEIQGAANDGFNDITAIERLINRVSSTHRDTLRDVITNIRIRLESNP